MSFGYSLLLLPLPRDTQFSFFVSCAAPSIFPLPPFVLFVTAHSTPLVYLPLGLPFNLTLSLLLAISRFISLLFTHLLLFSLSLSPRLEKSFSSTIDIENLILFSTANVQTLRRNKLVIKDEVLILINMQIIIYRSLMGKNT